MVLAGPLIRGLYLYPNSAVVLPQSTPEDVRPAGDSRSRSPVPSASEGSGGISLVATFLSPVGVAGPQLYGSQVCRKVESFGLAAASIRQLKNHRFRNATFVHVGHIQAKKTIEVFVFRASPESWPSSGSTSPSEFQARLNTTGTSVLGRNRLSQGGSIAFHLSGSAYRLSLTRVFIALFGCNSVAIDICEQG